MYKKSFNIAWLIFIISCTCCQENKFNNDPENLSPLWEKDFQVGLTSCINPVLMGENVLFSSYQSRSSSFLEPSKLISLDSKDGGVKWEWRNVWTNIPEDLDGIIDVFYIQEQIFYGYGSRIYSINAKNGSSIWFKQLDGFYFKNIFYEEGQLLTSFKKSNPERQELYAINKAIGDLELMYTFNIPDSVSQTRYYFSLNPDVIYHGMGRNKLNSENDRYVYPYISAYDRINDSILYETQLMEADWLTSVTHFAQYDSETLIATVNFRIVCVNARDGSIRWTVKLFSQADFSGFITTNTGLVYVNTEENVTCIDISNGEIIWQITPEQHGLSSRMVIHKGLLYYISANLLNVVDAATGDIIQKIVAPSVYNKNSGEGFQSVLTLDAENDRLYTASYTHAYCYPTLR